MTQEHVLILEEENMLQDGLVWDRDDERVQVSIIPRALAMGCKHTGFSRSKVWLLNISQEQNKKDYYT